MTEEELEKEAEEYARDTYEMCSYQGLPYASDRRARQQAFLAGAEPREKRIAELEHQLTHRNCLDCSNHSSKLRMRTLELEKENAELKKENQKWKDGIALKDEEIGCIETDFNTFKSKAKELLKRWVELYKPKLEGYPITPIQEQTEQFLKDLEK